MHSGLHNRGKAPSLACFPLPLPHPPVCLSPPLVTQQSWTESCQPAAGGKADSESSGLFSLVSLLEAEFTLPFISSTVTRRVVGNAKQTSLLSCLNWDQGGWVGCGVAVLGEMILSYHFWNFKWFFKESLSGKTISKLHFQMKSGKKRGLPSISLFFFLLSLVENARKLLNEEKDNSNPRLNKCSLRARRSHFNPILSLPLGRQLKANWWQTCRWMGSLCRGRACMVAASFVPMSSGIIW